MSDSAAPAVVEDADRDVEVPSPETCTAWARDVNDERLLLMGLLIESHARLTRVLGNELEASVGVPLTWFIVMVHLARSERGRLTMSQLGTEISVTSGGITRLVDRMTEAGLVERESCASDRRAIYVALTPQGEATLERAMAEHLAGIDRHLLAPLTEDDRASLAIALRKLNDGQDPVCPG
jgi:DNA-binding MarR family transcriptional regulator